VTGVAESCPRSEVMSPSRFCQVAGVARKRKERTAGQPISRVGQLGQSARRPMVLSSRRFGQVPDRLLRSARPTQLRGEAAERPRVTARQSPSWPPLADSGSDSGSASPPAFRHDRLGGSSGGRGIAMTPDQGASPTPLWLAAGGDLQKKGRDRAPGPRPCHRTAVFARAGSGGVTRWRSRAPAPASGAAPPAGPSPLDPPGAGRRGWSRPRAPARAPASGPGGRARTSAPSWPAGGGWAKAQVPVPRDVARQGEVPRPPRCNRTSGSAVRSVCG
jgi:hypothetical protein